MPWICLIDTPPACRLILIWRHTPLAFRRYYYAPAICRVLLCRGAIAILRHAPCRFAAAATPLRELPILMPAADIYAFRRRLPPDAFAGFCSPLITLAWHSIRHQRHGRQ